MQYPLHPLEVSLDSKEISNLFLLAELVGMGIISVLVGYVINLLLLQYA